jgi:uncharacterized protein
MTPELEALRPQIAAVCKQFRVRRLDVFGSAVDPRQFEPDRSDIDLLVEFAALPPGTSAEHFFGLQEALGALIGRRIDLVVERAIRNPYFRESVEASREPLYAS